jgi:hypothetical protein
MNQSTIQINPKYFPHLYDYTHRYELYWGGRGSGKSVFAIQKMISKAIVSRRKILVIRKYFTDLKLPGSGNKNVIQERHTIPIDDNAVLVTGFYEFIRMQEGKPVPGPSRFTMLVTKRGGEWRIAHHHSSPHVEAPK